MRYAAKMLETFGIYMGSLHHQNQKEGTIREIDTLFDIMLMQHSRAHSSAQLKQDIFALLVNGFKRGGFFVEFGATDGIDLSNTFLLEKEFGWRGILAEPGMMWHADLSANRECSIDFDCVWSKSGEELDFDMVDLGALSTLSQFSDCDGHGMARKNKETCKVRTISLLDLLQKHGAPAVIDYMSVDTEGSELDILSAFDFDRYKFNCITIEHNYTPAREPLNELMQKNGYKRVFDYLSKWDDWYVPVDKMV